MDSYGILFFVLGLILYFLTKKKYKFFIWLSGLGAGLFIGAIWAMMIVERAFSGF